MALNTQFVGGTEQSALPLNLFLQIGAGQDRQGGQLDRRGRPAANPLAAEG